MRQPEHLWDGEGRLTVCDYDARGLEKGVELPLGVDDDRFARHVVQMSNGSVLQFESEDRLRWDDAFGSLISNPLQWTRGTECL